MNSESALLERVARRPPLALRALGLALRAPLAWGALALPALVLPLAAALPWLGWMRSALSGRYAPDALIASLDESFRFDHRADLAALAQATGAGGAALALIALLCGVFCAGGIVHTLLAPSEQRSATNFLGGGARYFLRYLRVCLLSLALLALLGWLLHGMPWQSFVLEFACGLPGGRTEEFESEYAALAIGWLRDGLYALGFALTMVWANWTRLRLAIQDGRSVAWAGLATLGLLARHPLRALRPALALLLVQAALIAGLGAFASARSESLSSADGLFALALLAGSGAAAIVLGSIVRVAQYAAAAELSLELVPPTSKPDPWARRVGPPGGPQYPVDGDDYGLAV